MLNNNEIIRYSRHLLLPSIGVVGQEKLCKASVLVVGAGGLGSPILLYLASAGVGTIGIVDYDTLDLTNLQRQIIHTEEFVGKPKVTSAANFIKKLNSTVKVVEHNILLDSKNIESIIANYDVIVDGTDNAPTRYLLNDACVFSKKPLVSGGALRFDGQVSIFNYKDGPCYRCIYPVPPPPEAITNCNDGGVLGCITGIIGSIQALEVVKLIVGLEPAYKDKMLIFDGLQGIFRQVKIRSKNKNCPVCSETPQITSLIDYNQFCMTSSIDKTLELKISNPEERITVYVNYILIYRNIRKFVILKPHMF
jgi:adenylyltransferase/sulfurtransferase